MARAISGRGKELAAVEAFLDALRSGGSALVLEGEPGIGKTSVWLAGLESAVGRGYRVLSARPGGTEVRLAFAALGDLLDDLDPAVLNELPPPQQRALRAALLLDDADDAPLDQRLIGVALLSVLRVLAAASPTVIAIDDVQWLDSASAAAVEFATRRITIEPLGVFVTLRAGEPAPLPEQAERVAVEGLSIGALQHVLHERLGIALPRPTLRRVWDATHGNPFIALELVRAHLDRDGPMTEIELPPSLAEILQRRLGGFDAETRNVLLAVALAADPNAGLLRAVVGDDAWERLQAAVSTRVVEIDGERVRFTHPLLAAAVTANTDPARKRHLHRQLASKTQNPEQRARHLALAADGADADVARELDAAAADALRRGAPATTAELLEHAIRLTPPESAEDEARRTMAAAAAYERAGDATRASTILTELVERLPPGRLRAKARLLLIRNDTSGAAAIEHAEHALADAGADAKLRAAILVERAQNVEITAGPPAALRDAREALRLAEQSGDDELLLLSLSLVGHLETLTGGDEWLALLRRAQALQARGLDVAPELAPGHWIAVRRMWADELDEARELLEAEYRDAISLGDEASRSTLCFHLTQLETRAGAGDRALAYAQEGLDLEIGSGREQSGAVNLYARALAEAHFGDPAAARGIAEEALDVFQRLGDRFFTIHTRSVLAFLALAAEDYEGALAALEGLRALREEIGIGEPGIFPFDADEIEALVGAGRIDEAEWLAHAYEQRGRALDRPRLVATGQRCRALVLAARGRLDDGLAAIDEALEEHERLAVPVERARTLLVRGGIQRRARRKRLAREALEAALDTFEELGSRAWGERARAELGRIGGRAPSPAQLTPSERRVAELVAEGRSNKEVAAALFVTVNTVEGTLRHVYAKLGVRSRTELARRLSSA
jgi:DNA-binding CsgD family transcriptional regulator